MAMTQKNIVIIGGSYGGTSTAHYLLKHALPHLPDQALYQIILVNDMFPQEKLFVSLSDAFKEYPEPRFRFVHGMATKLDHKYRSLCVSMARGSTESIEYHALVIATGASTHSPLLGLNGNFESLQRSWAAFREALPTAKSIITSGGGPAGFETAGELGEYFNGRVGWFGSSTPSPKVAITIITSGANILPALRPALARKAEDFLAKVGVKFIKNARVVTVTPPGAGTVDVATKASLTLEDGSILKADLYIPATGTKPNTGFVDKVLLVPDGRIDTNASSLRVDKAGPRVYAVGDVASSARPAIHLILNAIPLLCANIKRDLLLAAGKDETSVGEERSFKEDMRETQMVPIGKSKGVGAAMGYQLPSFMIWLIKGRDYWLWTTGALWSGKQWSKEM